MVSRYQCRRPPYFPISNISHEKSIRPRIFQPPYHPYWHWLRRRGPLGFEMVGRPFRSIPCFLSPYLFWSSHYGFRLVRQDPCQAPQSFEGQSTYHSYHWGELMAHFMRKQPPNLARNTRVEAHPRFYKYSQSNFLQL